LHEDGAAAVSRTAGNRNGKFHRIATPTTEYALFSDHVGIDRGFSPNGAFGRMGFGGGHGNVLADAVSRGAPIVVRILPIFLWTSILGSLVIGCLRGLISALIAASSEPTACEAPLTICGVNLYDPLGCKYLVDGLCMRVPSP
jgi:hypothetical protein